jgi:type VI secretion system protein ImpH
MRPTKRKHEPAVIALLLAEPYRFSFTQLVSILLRVLQRQGIGRERALHTVLSFRNSLSLSFPASEVEALDVEPATQDPLGALRLGTLRRVRITPAFIGLLGASGTLPVHDAERIAARKSLGDDASQRELLDVMSTRLIGLFYEASVKYRVEHDLAIGDGDRLLPMMTALAGTCPPRAASAGQPVRHVRQDTAACFAGLLRTRPVAAGTVEQVLSSYFNVPVRLEQFVGCWDPIPENRRSTLGVTKPVLGISTALGTRLWRHDICARLHVGPVDEAQARSFLPGGTAGGTAGNDKDVCGADLAIRTTVAACTACHQAAHAEYQGAVASAWLEYVSYRDTRRYRSSRRPVDAADPDESKKRQTGRR